jgi:hypothetical protein
MAFFQAKQVVANKALPSPIGADDTTTIVGEFVVPTGLANGDIIEMAGLPVYAIPVDLTVCGDQVDSNGTPTVSLDCGYLSGNYGANDSSRTIGNEFFAADTSFRNAAGGFVRSAKKNGFMVTPATTEKGIGLKLAAGAATLVVGAKIRLMVAVVAAPLAM